MLCKTTYQVQSLRQKTDCLLEKVIDSVAMALAKESNGFNSVQAMKASCVLEQQMQDTQSVMLRIRLLLKTVGSPAGKKSVLVW